MHTDNKPQYNSWIRVRKLLILLVIDFCLFITLLVIDNLVLQLVLFIMIAIFSYILVIVGGSYYYFTRKNYQNIIHQHIVEQVKGRTTSPTRILDIGAGSGSLAIKLAKAYPQVNILAIDYWGEEWEYSQSLCEKNAIAEGVQAIEFIKASASDLPFETQTMDAITSCLTFHEVKDTNDIYLVLSEANRTLAVNGYYVYLDLFLDPKIYPNLDSNLNNILGHNYQLTALSDVIELPQLLKHSKVLGNAAILVGQKESNH